MSLSCPHTLDCITLSCNTLQHTATHCNTQKMSLSRPHTLDYITLSCNTLQHTATHKRWVWLVRTHLITCVCHMWLHVCVTCDHITLSCNTLQHTATHCNILQHTMKELCIVRTHWITSLWVATHCKLLQHTATHKRSVCLVRTHLITCVCHIGLHVCVIYDYMCVSCVITSLWVATHCNTLQHTATHKRCVWLVRTHLITCVCHIGLHVCLIYDYVWVSYVITCVCHLWLHHFELQHTATHCNTLQHTATHLITCVSHVWLQYYAMSLSCPHTLHYITLSCNTLQHTATHCNTLQHTWLHHHEIESPMFCQQSPIIYIHIDYKALCQHHCSHLPVLMYRALLRNI